MEWKALLSSNVLSILAFVGDYVTFIGVKDISMNKMQAIGQYLHEVLFIMLHKRILKLSVWMKPLCVTIHIKVLTKVSSFSQHL